MQDQAIEGSGALDDIDMVELWHAAQESEEVWELLNMIASGSLDIQKLSEILEQINA